MSWFLVALIAYFLNAVAMTVDKTLLKKEGGFGNPIVYTFNIAALGSAILILVIPFVFFIPSLSVILVSLAAGVVWVIGLVLMFKALAKDEATRVTSAIGGLTPIFVIVLAIYLLAEKFSGNQALGCFLLIAGAFLMSLDFQEHGAASWLKKKLGLARDLALPHIRKALLLALPAAIFFGLSDVLTKIVFNNTSFWNGFVWVRIGSFLAVLALLFSAKNRRDVAESFRKSSQGKKQSAEQKRVGLRFLFGQACGGVSALLKGYAISLGSVALINAIAGVQYAIVFLLVVILTKTAPKLLKEKLTREVVIQKVLAIVIIAAGLYLIK